MLHMREMKFYFYYFLFREFNTGCTKITSKYDIFLIFVSVTLKRKQETVHPRALTLFETTSFLLILLVGYQDLRSKNFINQKTVFLSGGPQHHTSLNVYTPLVLSFNYFYKIHQTFNC